MVRRQTPVLAQSLTPVILLVPWIQETQLKGCLLCRTRSCEYHPYHASSWVRRLTVLSEIWLTGCFLAGGDFNINISSRTALVCTSTCNTAEAVFTEFIAYGCLQRPIEAFSLFQRRYRAILAWGNEDSSLVNGGWVYCQHCEHL